MCRCLANPALRPLGWLWLWAALCRSSQMPMQWLHYLLQPECIARVYNTRSLNAKVVEAAARSAEPVAKRGKLVVNGVLNRRVLRQSLLARLCLISQTQRVLWTTSN
jgi:hypothetical protein